MLDYAGYAGSALELLKSSGVGVGDAVVLDADLKYEGVIMPQYEGGSQDVIVLKLRSGYNAGIAVKKISGARKMQVQAEKAAANDAPSAADPSLPRILLVSTGGTISSKVDYRTGAVAPAMTPEELSASVPELGSIARIETEALFSEYSENLQPEHWVRIAKRLDAAAKADYAGIIVAHGTDTMQHTAAYLSFALQGLPVPVAMVGSQRSSDRPSSDAAINLIAAAQFLASGNKRGIYVAMHHDQGDGTVAVHAGTRVRKNHTSKRGAFETVGGDPAFLVSGGGVVQNMQRGFFEEEAYSPKICLDPRVHLAKYYPGFDPGMVDAAAKAGCRAVILEGTGLGHVGRALHEPIRRAVQGGVFVGMASQCIEGRVNMSVYDSGRDLLAAGVTPLLDMVPEAALVKAMWAAGQAGSAGQIRELMLKRAASEFSD